MLFSVSSVFGRMTGANEVMAVKSLGINPMVLVWPALVLAAFLSLGTVWMYEVAATWCKPAVVRIACESLEEIAYSMLQKSHSFGGESYPFSATVKDVVGPKLIQPRITIKGPPTITITAAEAELRTDLRARKLWLICTDNEVDIEGLFSFLEPGTREYSLPIPEPVPPKDHRDYVATRDIAGAIARLQAEVKVLEQLREPRKALGQAELDRADKEISEVRKKIFRLRTEPYRRWANGFSCLFFALVGAPVAMLRRHADVLTNFFSCFLPILVVYYPLLMFGEDLSTGGKLPPISFWMANAVLVVPAVALLRRIINH